MTTHPTPGQPLSGDDVKLLVKGDLVRCERWHGDYYKSGKLYTLEERDGALGIEAEPAFGWDDDIKSSFALRPFTFIGRPGPDGWIPWSGGENPVPGQKVDVIYTWPDVDGVAAGGPAGVGSYSVDWSQPCVFRLASTVPVEADCGTHGKVPGPVCIRCAELGSPIGSTAPAEAPGHTDLTVSPESLDAFLEANPLPAEAGGLEPVEVTIFCPKCATPHVDEGEWATTRHHKTHQCQACGHEWRPFPFATVGVPHPALHPQPSGETREAVAREDAEVLAMLEDYAELHIGATPEEDMSLEEMLISKARERLALLRPAAPDGGGWQPIETAPKDGESILAICATAYSPVASVTWWNESWTHYSRPAEKWHGGVGRWFPTHWMPLPQAPAIPASEGGEG